MFLLPVVSCIPDGTTVTSLLLCVPPSVLVTWPDSLRANAANPGSTNRNKYFIFNLHGPCKYEIIMFALDHIFGRITWSKCVMYYINIIMAEFSNKI